MATNLQPDDIIASAAANILGVSVQPGYPLGDNVLYIWAKASFTVQLATWDAIYKESRCSINSYLYMNADTYIKKANTKLNLGSKIAFWLMCFASFALSTLLCLQIPQLYAESVYMLMILHLFTL